MADWRPAATLDTLRQRAGLLAQLRQFFAERGVMEVETPLLGHTPVTDVFIESVPVSLRASPGQALYLQTSPEYAMKRLLAAGSGPIFQICKAFRDGEVSRRHNPEFTMLEWYRPGFSLDRLMDEVEQLLRTLIDCGPVKRLSYAALFQEHLALDPHSASDKSLLALLGSRVELSSQELSRTDCLQLLMSHCIEPLLPRACFVYDYPVDQAALARIEADDSGREVARRFELYCQGMELANGYQELTDAAEQRRRFEADMARRAALQLPPHRPDERLLAALAHGLEDCAGVALGVDRLLMLLTTQDHIANVMSFDLSRS